MPRSLGSISVVHRMDEDSSSPNASKPAMNLPIRLLAALTLSSVTFKSSPTRVCPLGEGFERIGQQAGNRHGLFEGFGGKARAAAQLLAHVELIHRHVGGSCGCNGNDIGIGAEISDHALDGEHAAAEHAHALRHGDFVLTRNIHALVHQLSKIKSAQIRIAIAGKHLVDVDVELGMVDLTRHLPMDSTTLLIPSTSCCATAATALANSA